MKTKTGALSSLDIAAAATSPASVFDRPSEVLIANELSRDQKIEILKRWESDAQALQRATDENMSGGEQPPLDEINKALSQLAEIL